MFARFARIGVGHISRMPGRQSPSLVIDPEVTEDELDEDDPSMGSDVEHQATHDDHGRCGEGDASSASGDKADDDDKGGDVDKDDDDNDNDMIDDGTGDEDLDLEDSWY